MLVANTVGERAMYRDYYNDYEDEDYYLDEYDIKGIKRERKRVASKKMGRDGDGAKAMERMIGRRAKPA